MKRSKDELIDIISNLQLDDDIKLSMIEDISDSIEEGFVDDTRYINVEEFNKVKSQYDDLKNRYINRFKTIDSSKIKDKDEEEFQDDTVINVEDIY